MTGRPLDPRTPGAEPLDLAEIQAVDALLDRLGSRTPTVEDLQDDLFVALAGLAREVDEPVAGQDESVDRLLELMGDRPVWVLDGGTAADGDTSTAPMPGIPNGVRVIDLTGRMSPSARSDETAADGTPPDATTADATVDAGTIVGEDPVAVTADEATQDSTDAAAADATGEVAESTDESTDDASGDVADLEVAASETADPETAAGTPSGGLKLPIPVQRARTGAPRHPAALPSRKSMPVRLLRSVARPAPLPAGGAVAERRWQEHIRQAAMPIAAAVAIFAIGTGVSTVLGGDDPAPSTATMMAGSPQVQSIQAKLVAAQKALEENDVTRAKELLAGAEQDFARLSPAEQDSVEPKLQEIKQAIAPVVTPTSAPADESRDEPRAPEPAPADKPTGDTSKPAETTAPAEPTSEPSPGSTPSPTKTQPKEEPTTEPSPAPSTPGPGGSITGTGNTGGSSTVRVTGAAQDAPEGD